ncbi:MAG: DUF86 domain-containing protein [Bacteroidaceae bacterium]|nr:DUF86 domain-containing protein [Bacteroidaceae bacterium]
MQSWHNDIITDRLEQIREAISLINEWSGPYHTEEDFLGSPTGMAMLDASILRLQIIGESVRAIEDMTQGELLCHYTSIPWRNIIGLRNIISHDYANVNYTMIVKIIKNNLQDLDNTVSEIIIDLNNNKIHK